MSKAFCPLCVVQGPGIRFTLREDPQAAPLVICSPSLINFGSKPVRSLELRPHPHPHHFPPNRARESSLCLISHLLDGWLFRSGPGLRVLNGLPSREFALAGRIDLERGLPTVVVCAGYRRYHHRPWWSKHNMQINNEQWDNRCGAVYTSIGC